MLIILDRDGVINHDSDQHVRSPAAWEPLPGSLQAIADLKKAGFSVVIATNQSGIGRGYFTESTLEAMHQKMQGLLLAAHGVTVDAIYHCPHHPDEGCECRKPKPGMLLRIAEDFQVSLTGVHYVGDSWRDIKAARAAGCLPALVLTGRGAETFRQHEKELSPKEKVYDDLLALARAVTSA